MYSITVIFTHNEDCDQKLDCNPNNYYYVNTQLQTVRPLRYAWLGH